MEIGFSIIMPNYNSAYLERAINSVVNQTHDKWELIIISFKTIIQDQKKIH